MVYLGKAKFSPKTGVYIPIIVAQNMSLEDGDLLEFHIEDSELKIRKAVGNRIQIPERL